MSHVRAEIRSFVQELMEGVTPSKVFGFRHPLTPDAMPGICVYWTTEPADSVSAPNGATRRPLRMMTDIYVEGVEVDDEADAIAGDIERAVFGDESVGGRAIGVLSAGSSISRVDTTAVRHTVLKLAWDIIYRTKDGDPEHGI